MSANTALIRRLTLPLCFAALAACSGETAAEPKTETKPMALEVVAVDHRFHTRDHFIASIEMQLSGEPFAEAMGRDVGGFARDFLCQESECTPDVFHDPEADAEQIDLPGFSTAVESYEYSKQPMNNVAFESGAGTSLLFGPVLNPDGATGGAAVARTQDFLEHLARASNASRRADISAENPLGWPGFWPTLQPFSSWDPTIEPTHEDHLCSLTSDDNPGIHGALTSNDYECDYTSLHLPRRSAQVSMTIDPGSSGFFAWKAALWSLNYLQVMHDVRETAVDHVSEAQLDNVGIPGNTTGPSLNPGTYLGSSNIEGFQAGALLAMLDNQCAQWLTQLSTADGTTLDGFASLADALAYRSDSELRWFPSSIRVTEAADDSGFPRPQSYAIASSESQLLDLAGLLGAYASAYALTDHQNVEVGGSQAARAYFDGDPFPAQNQTPTGEPTLHDRALAMLRVLVVDMDRLHVDPTTQLFADQADVVHGKLQRGQVLSSDVAAYTLLALRTAHRALGSELTLYGNTTPDTANIPSPLDAFPLNDRGSFGQRLNQLIAMLADTFYDKLSEPEGRAYAGWDLAKSAPLGQASELDAHTAAIRGLLVAYLATGATKYRDRALRVWQRLDDTFYDPGARIYRSTANDRGDQVTFTPRRFGLLQAAVRDTYELIASLPGHDALGALLEERVGRLNTLLLNGWDDRNRDGRIQWPSECAQLGTGPDGQPLGLGGLQLAERTLTGDTGGIPDADSGERVRATDREHDCVPEISAVGLPSALASSITFRTLPLRGEPRP